MDKVTITFKNGTKKDFPKNTTLLEISEFVKDEYEYPIISVIYNNKIKDLNAKAKEDACVEFYDMSTELGMKVYQRSLIFIMILAARDIFPKAKLIVEHSLSKGLYCELKMDRKLREKDVFELETKMHSLIESALPIVRKKTPLDEAARLFEEIDLPEKAKLLRHIGNPFVHIYYCAGHYDYFFRTMVPNTGYLKYFSLKFYSTGFILRYPAKEAPFTVPPYIEMSKLAKIFLEAERWAKIIKCDYITSLNQYIDKGETNHIVRLSEALQEKKIAQIADYLTAQIEHLKLAIIAGPSSSGKTTFAKRLGIQMEVNGIKTVELSIDDYFIDKDKRPLDENNEVDFESIEIIDIPLFNEHLKSLLSGEEIEIPRYDFKTGKRVSSGETLKLEENQILVIEGIHGLNERLTYDIPRISKAKIYISSLTQIAIDQHNRIPTTDARLIRRIVRDYQFRGRSALETLQLWPSVRKGEERNIFPFSEEADIMFNSSLIYELSVLKNIAVPLLKEVGPENFEYSEAKRLIRLISFFKDIESAEIPLNSIIREFIGKEIYT